MTLYRAFTVDNLLELRAFELSLNPSIIGIVNPPQNPLKCCFFYRPTLVHLHVQVIRTKGSFLLNLPILNVHIWNQPGFFSCRNKFKSEVTKCLYRLLNEFNCRSVISAPVIISYGQAACLIITKGRFSPLSSPSFS